MNLVSHADVVLYLFANINCMFLKSAWTKGYFYLMVSTLVTDYKVVFCCCSDCTVTVCIMSIPPPPPLLNKKRLGGRNSVDLLFVLSALTFIITFLKIAHKKACNIHKALTL